MGMGRWIGLALAAGALGLGAGCGGGAESDGTASAAAPAAVAAEASQDGSLSASGGTLAASDATAASADSREVTVYASPTCGCCKKWVAHMEQHGYEVRTVYNSDIASVKRRLGVPDRLQSCHTAVVGGYLVEGHVPAESVDRLLEQRPEGVRGLAVPGMPTGSPGMEVPGVPADPYDVVAFTSGGDASVFASYRR